MQNLPIEEAMIDAIIGELGQSTWFKDLTHDELKAIAGNADMWQFDPGDTLMQQGDPSDSFYLIVSGEVIVKIKHDTRDELVEVARVKPFDTVGELGLLLNQPRSATVVAGQDAVLLKFNEEFFTNMFQSLPPFGLVTCRVLGQRLQQSSRSMLLPLGDTADVQPDPEALKLLRIDFMQRHRVLPLNVEGNSLDLGFVEDPTAQVMNMVRELLPGMEISPKVIQAATFNAALQSMAGGAEWSAPTEAGETGTQVETTEVLSSPKLDVLLKRMVAEGASDIHLTTAHKPRWRIDGEIMEMSDTSVLGPTDVMDLCEPIMMERNREEFLRDNDSDLAYAIPDVSRFRVNMFRDNKGVGAVLRQIPDKILAIEQLGLPPVIRRVCDYPKGMIVVTGPTGSGKSTTLAAMIDHINKTRKAHIITLEDPIEFVHQSQMCLVNQREVGPHTGSFSRALRAALREDPDIVLVGEMRDLETVSLALETANTGHLVFGTLHTNTAVSTLSRIIDMFPAGQQNQVRTVLADSMKSVIAQSLCKRIGGGRVAALEILVSDVGMASMIREGKTQQLMSAMQMGKSRGNRLLNEELTRMVEEQIIDLEEALSKAVDKNDLCSKLGIEMDDASQE